MKLIQGIQINYFIERSKNDFIQYWENGPGWNSAST